MQPGVMDRSTRRRENVYRYGSTEDGGMFLFVTVRHRQLDVKKSLDSCNFLTKIYDDNSGNFANKQISSIISTT